MTRDTEREEPIVAKTEITYAIVNALESWRQGMISTIRSAVANASSGTSTDEDQTIAEAVYDELLEAQVLILPEVEE